MVFYCGPVICFFFVYVCVDVVGSELLTVRESDKADISILTSTFLVIACLTRFNAVLAVPLQWIKSFSMHIEHCVVFVVLGAGA